LEPAFRLQAESAAATITAAGLAGVVSRAAQATVTAQSRMPITFSVLSGGLQGSPSDVGMQSTRSSKVCIR